MQIPVLVEPIATGFRASTGGPLNLVVEAPTADEAMMALQKVLKAKLSGGTRIRSLVIPDVEALRTAGRAAGDNPIFEEWVQAVEEYRRLHNTVPEA